MTESEVLEALQAVVDPEIGIDIVNLGLVVGVETAPEAVRVRLVMTSAACPLHRHLAREAEAALRRAAAPGTQVTVEVVDSPAWSPERMSDAARRKLGW